jgi:hypothetical protein
MNENVAGSGPPPIGEALGAAWRAYQANMGPVLIGSLCALLLSFVPLVGGILAIPGMCLVALKAVRGQEPEPADGFVSFNAVADHLVLGLLQMVGGLLCCIGFYVTFALFLPGTFMAIEERLTWQQAKDRCMAEVAPHWLSWTLFGFVSGLVGATGILLCGIGIFFTLPITYLMWAYAYDRTLAKQ